MGKFKAVYLQTSVLFCFEFLTLFAAGVLPAGVLENKEIIEVHIE